MSEFELLNKRVNYLGGKTQSRMIQGKLEALKQALVSSYQAATAILEDGREFRCLINPDKLNVDQDDKMISIPFKDVCLNKDRKGTTTQGQEEIGMKPGDTFTWKETNTHWLVCLQYIEELAYFRATIRKCTDEVEIGGKRFWCYIRGPIEKTINWKNQERFYWNELNYTLLMNISKTPETEAFFKRFARIKINGKTWEVQAVDSMSVDGIIEVALEEFYENTMQELKDAEPQEPAPISRIQGEFEVYPYEKYDYTIDLNDGTWEIDNLKLAVILNQNENSVTIGIIAGRTGEFNLVYKSNSNGDFILPIKIKSL